MKDKDAILVVMLNRRDARLIALLTFHSFAAKRLEQECEKDN